MKRITQTEKVALFSLRLAEVTARFERSFEMFNKACIETAEILKAFKCNAGKTTPQG